MSEKHRDCVTLLCDGCGKDIDVEMEDGVRHFESGADAREEVNEFWEDGYAVCTPDGDWCGNCRTKPHAYVPIDRPYKPDTRCMRCLVEKDDHEPAEHQSGTDA